MKLGGDYGEFVAAQTGDHIHFANGIEQSSADFLEHRIAGRVPQIVVNSFETVQIEETFAEVQVAYRARQDWSHFDLPH